MIAKEVDLEDPAVLALKAFEPDTIQMGQSVKSTSTSNDSGQRSEHIIHKSALQRTETTRSQARLFGGDEGEDHFSTSSLY
jgi:hypothetical protein